MAHGNVLIIDNDRDIAEIVRAVLSDEGYRVAILAKLDTASINAAIGKLEPDAVLLDGESHLMGYGASWETAAHLAARDRPVPVIMFTAHGGDLAEARAGTSSRSRAAHFSGVLAKPFEVDQLLDVVAQAVGGAVPFDTSTDGDRQRTERLASDLEHAGATDVRLSARREWVTFRTPRDRLMQIYWWDEGGSYLLGRYDGDGKRLENIALTYDRASAVEICASLIRGEGAAGD